VSVRIRKLKLPSSLLYKNLKIKIYRTIILPFVLYECETWSLTLREEPRLTVFEIAYNEHNYIRQHYLFIKNRLHVSTQH